MTCRAKTPHRGSEIGCIVRNRFGIAGKRTCRVNKYITVKVTPTPVVRQVTREVKKEPSKTTISPAISKSNSTVPNTYLRINDMRLWSWELGDDKECIHTGLISVGKVCKVVIQYYATGSSESVAGTLSCIEIRSGDIINFPLVLDVEKENTIIMLEKSLDLVGGIYIFKLTAKSKIFIVGLLLESESP